MLIDALAVLIIVVGLVIYITGLRDRSSELATMALMGLGTVLWVVVGPTIILLNHPEIICAIGGPKTDVRCR